MTNNQLNETNINEKSETDTLKENDDFANELKKNEQVNSNDKKKKDSCPEMKKFNIGQDGDIADNGSIQIKENSGNINIYYSDDNKKKKYFTHNLHDKVNLLNTVFVESKNYLKLNDEMKDNNVIIIYGTVNTGRFSAGLKHVSDKKLKSCFEIITDGCEFEGIRDISFERNSGYLLRNISISNIKTLNSNVLLGINDTLKNMNSYLVIIVDDSMHSFIKRDAFKFSFNWICDYNKEQIIYNHILMYCRNKEKNEIGELNEIKVKKIINNDEVKELIRHLSIADIPSFAYAIADGLRKNVTEKDIVEKFTENIDLEIEKFVESSDTCSEKLFILTLAMLEGLSYNQIMEAYELLKSKLEYHLSVNDLEEINQKNYLMIKRSDRLKKVRAYIKNGEEKKEYGIEKVELIKFQNKRYSNTIVEYFWREFDSWRNAIIEWLIQLGNDSDYYLVKKVTKSLGYISTFDFDSVKEKIKNEWVIDGGISNKISTAKVLNYVSKDDNGMIMKQLNLIQNWATSKNNEDLNEAAIYCYAFLFERISLFDKDLKNIKKIIKNNDLLESHQLRYAIYFCFRNLFRYKLNDDESCKKLLNCILQLLDSKDKYTSRYMKLLFLSISDELHVKVNVDLKYPIFLWIFFEKKFLSKKIITLWRSCIVDTKIRELSIESIQYIFNIADENSRLYVHLEKFIIELIKEGTNQDLNILIKYLDNWVKKELDGCKTARKFLKSLRKKLNPLLMSQNQINS